MSMDRFTNGQYDGPLDLLVVLVVVVAMTVCLHGVAYLLGRRRRR